MLDELQLNEAIEKENRLKRKNRELKARARKAESELEKTMIEKARILSGFETALRVCGTGPDLTELIVYFGTFYYV
jgi:hypothetical protein